MLNNIFPESDNAMEIRTRNRYGRRITQNIFLSSNYFKFMMNSNESSSSQYLQQLLNSAQHTDGLVMKSEEDHDFNGNSLPFLSDCGYFGHQNSPEHQFPNMHSPSGFSNASTLFNSSSCSPNNPIISNGAQTPHPAINQRVRINNYVQRIPIGAGMLGSANMEQLPDTTIFPGVFDFQLSLGPHTESATKSADFTYSRDLKKLYVQRGAQCPFKFKTSHRPPPNSYVKILPVFKGTHVLSEPVRRCSNHAEGDDEGNPRYHFIRSNNRQTQYDTSDCGRLYLTIPYTGPQVGAEYQVELLSFMCFNSCGHSSHSKRRIDVIFMLENNGQVLGRQVIEVRVCACPGRDRTNEESNMPKNGLKHARKCSYNGPGRGGKRRKLSSVNGDEEYTIKTNNPVYHQILLQILETLEAQIPQMADLSNIRNHSPVSTASSPGNVFKALPEIDSTEEDA